MAKPIKNILCFSQQDFEKIVDSYGWNNYPPSNVSVISICSPNNKKNHLFDLHENVFNIDIDDSGPTWFGQSENKLYDDAYEMYKTGKIKLSNAFFNSLITNANNELDFIHVLDYDEAFSIVQWIEYNIIKNDIIYVHCEAGLSRSQAIVRYILDTYSDKYDIRTNPNNPCLTPNMHIVKMLKRCYRYLFSDFYNMFTKLETEYSKYYELYLLDPKKYSHEWLKNLPISKLYREMFYKKFNKKIHKN